MTTAAPAATAPAAPSARRLWQRVLLALAVLFVLLGAVLFWLLGTQSGLNYALSLAAPMVEAVEPHGTLASGFRAERIDVTDEQMHVTIQSPVLVWRLSALLAGRVHIQTLEAARITFASAPSEEETPPRTEPLALPKVALPVSLQLERLHVGEFALQDWASGEETALVRELTARASSDGRQHRIETLTATIVPIDGQLALEAAADTAAQPYTATAHGTLSGTLPGAMEGKTHALAARLDAEGALDALPLQLAATVDETARVQLEATLNALLPMPLMQAHMQAQEINPAHFAASAPAARLDADLQVQQTETPPEQPWQLTGTLALNNAASGTLDKQQLPLESLSTALVLAAEAVRLDDLRILLRGDGTVTGRLGWQADANRAGLMQADITLANLHPQALDATLPAATLAGRIEAQGTPATQSARVQLATGKAQLHLDGEYHADDARFSAQGALKAVNPAEFVASAPAADLNLDFQAQGTLQDAPVLAADFRFQPSTFAGRALSGEGKLRIHGEALDESTVQLALGSGKLHAAGRWGRAGDHLKITLDAPKLADFDILQQGLDGRLKLAADLSGTAANPAARVDLDAGNLRLPGGLQLASAFVKGHVDWADAGKPAPLHLDVGLDGLTQPDAEPEKRSLLRHAEIALRGERSAHTLIARVSQNDRDRAHIELAGGLSGQDFDHWKGKIQTLKTEGRLAARLQAPATLSLAPQAFELGDARLTLGTQGELHLRRTAWREGKLHAQGELRNFAVDLAALDANAAAPANADPLVLGGQWDIALADTLSGSARIVREKGDLRLPGERPFALGIKALDARLNAEKNRLQLALDLQGTTFGALKADLATALSRDEQGGWTLAPTAPLQGDATLNAPDLAWVSHLVPDQLVRTAGEVHAKVKIAGTLAAPQVTGKVDGKELAIAMPEQGLDLSGGTLQASFDRDRLNLTRLAFVSPNKVRPNGKQVPVERFTKTPGTLTASGNITLSDATGNFTFAADRLPVLQRKDRWLLLSGKGNARQDATLTTLKADFKVDSGYIEMADVPAPSIGSDVVTVEEQRAAEEAARAAENANRKPSGIQADIHIDLGRHLYLSAMGLRTRLTGALDLRQRDQHPLSAIGMVSTRDGIFRGYGQDLTIERGIINFQGPLDNPGLNLLALRKGLDVEAGVEVLGSARRPVIKLVSHPEVAEIDKLAWIVLGRASNGGPGDLALLATAARALFSSGDDEGGVAGALHDSLGLDIGLGAGEMGATKRAKTSSVVADGTEVTQQGNASQNLTLGKRLTDRLTLSFEQSLTDAQTLAKLTYQISRNLSLVIRGGENNSADVYYTISFR